MYIDRPPFRKLSTDANGGKYNKILSRAYKPFLVLPIIEHKLTVDENDFLSIIGIEQATTSYNNRQNN